MSETPEDPTDTPTPPETPTPDPTTEVRQNRIPGDWQFGSVAVAQDLVITDTTKWGVMNKDNGGHWSTTPELEGWTKLDAIPES